VRTTSDLWWNFNNQGVKKLKLEKWLADLIKDEEVNLPVECPECGWEGRETDTVDPYGSEDCPICGCTNLVYVFSLTKGAKECHQAKPS